MLIWGDRGDNKIIECCCCSCQGRQEYWWSIKPYTVGREAYGNMLYQSAKFYANSCLLKKCACIIPFC